MILIALVLALTASWFFEFGPLADISGWWVIGASLATFAWFEFGEPILGLDRKKNSADSLDKIRQERVKKTFGKK